jgi:hypothetical protein
LQKGTYPTPLSPKIFKKELKWGFLFCLNRLLFGLSETPVPTVYGGDCSFHHSGGVMNSMVGEGLAPPAIKKYY